MNEAERKEWNSHRRSKELMSPILFVLLAVTPHKNPKARNKIVMMALRCLPSSFPEMTTSSLGRAYEALRMREYIELAGQTTDGHDTWVRSMKGSRFLKAQASIMKELLGLCSEAAQHELDTALT